MARNYTVTSQKTYPLLRMYTCPGPVGDWGIWTWSPRDTDCMRTIDLTREPVELYKILKFEGLVASGGEARRVITEGLVSVNGAVETRKRKKIVAGDRIEFAGEAFEVRLA